MITARALPTQLLYPLKNEFARLAAAGLARAKYELPNISSSDDAFNLLAGLATVVAVMRSETLASEVRLLMRAVRRKPDIEIETDGALRIGLIAAAAFVEIGGWTRFIGELVTELSFEEMTRQKVGIVWQFVEILRHLEPALWQTTSRADAALQAAFAYSASEETEQNQAPTTP